MNKARTRTWKWRLSAGKKIFLATGLLFFGLTAGIQAGSDLDLPILMYHGFTAGPAGMRYQNPIAAFADQIAWLHDQGYIAVLPEDLRAADRGERPLPERAMMLTFDDWPPSQYELAIPLIESYDFKGVFFVDLVSLQNPEARERLKDAHDRGHVIGSHTVNHRFLANRVCLSPTDFCCGRGLAGRPCNDDDVRYELERSKQELEALLGGPVTALAWPGGSFNERTIELALAAGYETIFAVFPRERRVGWRPRYTAPTTELSRIYRIEIGGGCDLAGFARSLSDRCRCLGPGWRPSPCRLLDGGRDRAGGSGGGG